MAGFTETIDRCNAYVEAGADMIFVEALTSVEEMRQAIQAIPAPLVANMVEGGKTPLLSVAELRELGFKLVIFPGTAFRSALKSITEAMWVLYETGSTMTLLDKLYGHQEAFELAGFSEHRQKELALPGRK